MVNCGAVGGATGHSGTTTTETLRGSAPRARAVRPTPIRNSSPGATKVVQVSDEDPPEWEVRNSPEEARIRKLEERMADMVHAADLWELVEQFRERARFAEHAADNETAADIARQNADELEELIRDE